MGKKKKKGKEKREKEYRYYDVIHKTYIEVPNDLRPILETMDRRTRYLVTDQYIQNNTFMSSDLLFVHEKYKSFFDKEYENILYKICAEEFWKDMESALKQEELIFLDEIYLQRLDDELPFYKTDSYEKNRSRLRKIFKKLRKFFNKKKHVGKTARAVYENYFE